MNQNIYMTLSDFSAWMKHSPEGLIVSILICCVFSIFVICYTGRMAKRFVRPSVEHAFYNVILKSWVGTQFKRHKIIGAAVKLHGSGEKIIDAIICLISTFIVVAALASTITALVIYFRNDGFVYSDYFIVLGSLCSALTCLLVKNIHYFYRFIINANRAYDY